MCRHDGAMTNTPYSDTTTEPLVTDALIEKRVAALIGRACSRQLWLLFLDAESIQLPALVAIDDHPSLPDDSVVHLAERVRSTCTDEGAHSVVVVIERYAGPDLSVPDLHWARALGESLDEAGVPLRAILLSHRRGVRWIAPDDYRF